MTMLELYNEEEHKLKLKLLPAKPRDTAYYSCMQAQLVTSSVNRPVQLYKFVGLASPNNSLLDIYYMLALPSSIDFPLQLVEFAVRCAQIYLKLGYLSDLTKDFLDSGKDKRRVSFQLEQLIETISKMNEYQLNNFNYSFYQSITAETLSPNFTRKASEQVQFFITAIRSNLERYEIIPRALRIIRLKELARLLLNQWETEILHGRSDWYLITKDIQRKDSSRSVTLADVLQNGMQVKLSEKIVEKIGISLLGELDLFRQRTKQRQDERAVFHLTTDNIILHIQENNSSIIAETPCSVDYFHPFLQELGLARRPSSIETAIIFNATPQPNLFTSNWIPIISELAAESQSKTSVAEFICVIRWILIMDLLYCRALSQPRLALVETAASPKLALQEILSMQHHLAPQVQSILLLLQLENDSPSLLLEDLALSDLHDMMVKPVKPSDLQYFEERKFEFLKMMFESWERLFFANGGVKDFLSRSRLMAGNSQAQKTLLMFMLGKFVQLRVQEQVYNIYGENQNINAPLYKLERYISKWQQLTETAETKLTNWETDKRSDLNSQYLNNHPNVTQLFKLLRNLPYQHYSRSPIAAKQLPDHIKQLFEQISSFIKTLSVRIEQSKKESLPILQQGYQAQILVWLFLRVTRFNSFQLSCYQTPLPLATSAENLRKTHIERKINLITIFAKDQDR